MRRTSGLLVVCGVAAGLSSVARGQALPANVLVVRQGAAPGGNGLTWATAFDDIYDALAAVQASGGTRNELWFTGGSYGRRTFVSTCGENVSVPLTILGPLEMYGGFVGVEFLRNQRGVGGAGIQGLPLLVDRLIADRVGFSSFGASQPPCGGSGQVTIRNSTLCQSGASAGGKRGGSVSVSDSVAEDSGFSAMCGSSFSSSSFNGSGSVFRRCSISGSCSSGFGAGINGGTYEDCSLSAANGQIGGVSMLRSSASAFPPGSLPAFVGCRFVGSTVSSGTRVVDSISVNSSFGIFPPFSGCYVGGTLTNSFVDCRENSLADPNQSFAGTTLQWTTVNPRYVGFVTGPGVDAGSPIDTGNNNLVPVGLFTDVNGNPRFAGTATPGSGVGGAPRVDRGAIEAVPPGTVVTSPAFCYPNMDGSSAVVGGTAVPTLTGEDFAAFVALYRAGHPLANCDGSTTAPVLSPADFTCFLAKFRAGC